MRTAVLLLAVSLAACESPTLQTEQRPIRKPTLDTSGATSPDTADAPVATSETGPLPETETTPPPEVEPTPSVAPSTPPPSPPAPRVATVAPTSTILATYEGRLADGTVFDSGSGVRFPLPDLIPGMQSALVGMVEGESKTFVIPPDRAYGERGIPGRVPPNATLTFDVTVDRILD